ncbi:DnaD domain-containing protein [Fundicoccus culcitae]|uniref:DnaD domain protein n=1 Tax=Fundicoccus culcitae TaxID=2969821 RepID=A0ABY5P7G3_9LACT|nr:DnaD domain protein [Fundicoccus culcitae]UUX34531.1 DnaD domain protein [Fundicoccus culcitae]
MKSTIYDWLKSGHSMVPNILLNQFHKLNVTGDEFVLILYLMTQISNSQSSNQIDHMSISLGWDQQKIFDHLNSLMDKDYLAIELVPDQNGKQSDHYTLRPLFEKLDSVFFQKEEKITAVAEDTSLVSYFEKEFGRVLSPIELEVLNNWIVTDKYPEDLIKLALKQAVLNQAFSFKYIEAILLNWQKSNVRTVHEAEKQIEQFNQKHQTRAKQADDSQYDNIEIPILRYNQKDRFNSDS